MFAYSNYQKKEKRTASVKHHHAGLLRGSSLRSQFHSAAIFSCFFFAFPVVTLLSLVLSMVKMHQRPSLKQGGLHHFLHVRPTEDPSQSAANPLYLFAWAIDFLRALFGILAKTGPLRITCTVFSQGPAPEAFVSKQTWLPSQVKFRSKILHRRLRNFRGLEGRRLCILLVFLFFFI